MKSPFPGMDPYLERHWRDVHGTLVIHARAMLNRQLGGDLRARVDERVVVEVPGEGARWISPDVRVVERGLPGVPVRQLAGVSVAEPLVLPRPNMQARERYIEIFDPAGGSRLVAVIEFVSPTNKLPGTGREKYLQKQREVVQAGVNLVEVDLTRTGPRDVAYPAEELPLDARSTYLACAFRGFDAQQFEIYPIALVERLPAIRIPLRPTDEDVVLDLQALVETTYEEGRYDDIDYSQPAVPPLTGDEAVWADRVLREAGKR